MLTKAIIQSIDYTKNICRVRIPLFETAARNVTPIETDAQINIVPGIYNSYKIGDIVFIGFEENKIDLPVILGKLFVSAASEAASCRGNLSGNSLAVTETAQLPHSTIFNYDQIAQNSSLYKNLNTPKKLADSILDLQRSQIQRYQTVIEVTSGDDINTDNYTIYNLYLKTSSAFSYTSNEPAKNDSLYRLCTALKNSQTENIPIPLDLVIIKNIINKGTEDEKVTYLTRQALLCVQEFNSDILKLGVVIDGVKHDIVKEDKEFRNDFLSIQSTAIQY